MWAFLFPASRVAAETWSAQRDDEANSTKCFSRSNEAKIETEAIFSSSCDTSSKIKANELEMFRFAT